MKKATTISAALGLTASLALAGCAGAGSSARSVSTTLTIALTSQPNSLDPAQSATGAYLSYIDPAYATLLTLNSDGSIAAGLADKWGYVGSGNTKFQLTLRSGVKFADGTPVTAADVIKSFTYFQKGSGPAASYFRPLMFSSPDSSTVLVTSAVPNPDMAVLFTPEFLGGAIISPAGLATPAKLASETFGAGPYVYDASASVSGDHYVYTPNKNYYDQSAIHFQKIVVRVIPNENSELQALKSGQIDVMYGTPDVAPSIVGSSSLATLKEPTTWVGLFLLDRDGKVVKGLADERVRQALNFAIDRVAITKAVYGDYGTPLSETALPGYDGYSASVAQSYPYDPAKAKQLLAAAGYANGLTVPVNYPSFDASATKLLEAVQGQLAQVGVNLQLTADTNFGGWINDLLSKKFGATMLSPGQGGDPNYYAQQAGFTKTGIMNVFGVDDPAVDTAFSQLASATPQTSSALAQNLTNVITQQALALPVSASDTIVMYNAHLHGLLFPKGSSLPSSVTTWTNG